MSATTLPLASAAQPSAALPLPARSPVSAAVVARLLAGETVIAGDQMMAALEATLPEDAVLRLRSSHNPGGIGVQDRYLASLRPLTPHA